MISVDEIFNLVKAYNSNYEETNLRNFISNNMSSLKGMIGITKEEVDTVDELLIELKDQSGGYINNYSVLYYLALAGVMNDFFTYNLEVPNFLTMNLNADNEDFYWTNSSFASEIVFAMFSEYIFIPNNNDDGFIRPVITIPKIDLL